MSDSPHAELGISETIQQNLLAKSRAISAELPPLTPEKVESTKSTIQRFSQINPEATLVGGWALRLLMENRGYPIPDVPALDIDFKLTPEGFAKMKQEFDFEAQSDLAKTFRRKGETEPVPESMGGGTRNFMKSPNNYTALEDNVNEQHVDVYLRDIPEETTSVEINGNDVRIVTAEELMLRRFSEVVSRVDTGVIPSKAYKYLYLNLGIIDFDKTETLWSKKGNIGTFIDAMEKLDKDLTDGQNTGKIKLEDIFH